MKKINLIFFLVICVNSIFSKTPFICNPRELVNVHRFDVMAKYIYAKHYIWGIKDGWPLELYAAHLLVWNNFIENLPLPTFPHYHCAKQFFKKNGLGQFIYYFNALLDDMVINKFDINKSILPIRSNYAIIDGSHRLGAALACNVPVTCQCLDYPLHDYSAEFFKNKKDLVPTGLAEEYLDAMALEYARLKENTYVVSLFPVGNEKYREAKKLLKSTGMIVYDKDIYMYNNGPFNYVHLSYEGESWLGSLNSNCENIHSKARAWFPNGKGIVKIILYECENLAVVKKIKDKIRALYGTREAVHINDTHAETVRLAETIFIKNGIHWLNHAKITIFKKFDNYFNKYKAWLMEKGLEKELFCLDSGAVLAAYGLRDCNDLDYLYAYDTTLIDISFINNHESELKYHQFNKNDIICNPRNHFYYKGMKFAALRVVRAMKLKRNEEKDKQDVSLINAMVNS